MELLLPLSLLLTTLTLTTPTSTLDPKQLTALQSMGLPTTIDPCSPRRNATTACDSSAPFRHLVSLTLSDCPPDLDIPSTALRSLSTLRSLSFLRCPAPALRRPLPPPLAASLRSFSCVSSLRRLSGVWLSRLKNLTSLEIAYVPVSASAPFVFLSQMPHLASATVSGCNLTGSIPHHWHSLNLTRLDLSSNRLTGPVPSSINVLGSLELLNLSSNALSGTLPHTIGDLIYLKNVSFSMNLMSGPVPDSIRGIPDLTHLDLSSNQFNGTLPRFLAEMKKLKYLNLQDNSFEGVVPFNLSFIRSLKVFKIGGNSNLCYNHSLLSSKLELGIAPCDKYGMPASPPPDKSAKTDSEDYDDGGGDDGTGGDESGKSRGDHGHGPNKLVLGVAVGLSCLVFLVIFLACISKRCS